MTETEIRCFCRRAPLLGVGRLGTDGSPYLHVRSTRNKHVDVEVIVTSGTAHLKCRECERWHHINVGEVMKGSSSPSWRLPDTLTTLSPDKKDSSNG